MENYFILHGSFSNPSANWHSTLAEKLRSRFGKCCVYTPDFPKGVGVQNYKNWSGLMRAYCASGLIDETTTIIAYSSAPIFITKFLIENKIKVKKLIFVCGFNNYFSTSEDYNSVNGSFYYSKPERVKNYAKEIVCLYSDNDPYVDFAVEKDFADKVSTKQIVIKGGGHLNAESCYTTFEQLEKLI